LGFQEKTRPKSSFGSKISGQPLPILWGKKLIVGYLFCRKTSRERVRKAALWFQVTSPLFNPIQ
jgi:hypothetical protein